MRSSPARPPLKARLAAGERLLGGLLRLGNEELVEMVAVSGFDFVLLDAEHGPADVGELRRHLVLAQVHSVPVLVRVGGHEPALVLRVLDAGAEGVVAPHIDTPEQAAALVASAHYPPSGLRGFATYGRAGRFGLVDPAEHARAAADQTLVFGMIESPAGVTAADAIARTPGLDGIMVGTADLRASSTVDDPDPADALASVHRTLAATGCLRMDIVLDRGQAQASFAAGAQLVVYNLTATVMAHLTDLSAAERDVSA
ncbi:HpcH/HpaI aldolase/citrate lyase family protein [uncultured Friedmanniella sp.]|uniref:HpcH/HpaI aldolase family protein n=1 Tax=uncultured Friedmanniella sp. TaxID=335381 RepID=UPI0035CC61C1